MNTIPPPIAEIENEISQEFGFLEEWADKYEHLISLARNLEPMGEGGHHDENKVKGCQSSVWLTAEQHDGRIWYQADSDSLIVKGLAALLVRILSGQAPEDIIKAQLNFLDGTGLQSHLSPTRSNGLAAMIKQMKFYALAFSAK